MGGTYPPYAILTYKFVIKYLPLLIILGLVKYLKGAERSRKLDK